MPACPYRLTIVAAALALVLCLAGCDRSGVGLVHVSSSRGPRFRVLAAENFWGSLAAQLAGDRASVQSVIVNPNTDPHSYQPTARDARAFAAANVAIVNGVGYDDWAEQLLQASPSRGRDVLNVGSLLGLEAGANPHRWYFPADVLSVVRAIVRDYDRVDPVDGAYFLARQRLLEGPWLARYRRLLDEIRARYAGVPVGYSESIFQGMGEYLGLKLLTPYSFAKAIAEGVDVSARDKETVDTQAQSRRIAVWICNGQNLTPDVQRVNQLARQHHIPIVTITETLSPASASFEQWQSGELEGLLAALRQARP